VEPQAVTAPSGSTLAHTHPDSYGSLGSVLAKVITLLRYDLVQALPS
jgi:hypothetical protein